MKLINTLTVLGLVLFIPACDLLDTEIPSNEILEEEALSSKENLQQVLNSSYDVLANLKNGRSQRLAELLSDNIDDNFTDGLGFFREVYNRNTNFFNSEVGDYYEEPYFAIFRVNTLLEAVNDVEMTAEERTQMIAEGRFIRAVCHFDLVNMMAHPPGTTADNSHLGIPIRTSTSAEPELRSTVADSYQAIKEDFWFAAKNLPASNGAYATNYAANGYLAKVHFMEQDYDSAIYYADTILENSPYSLSGDINARYSQNITSEMVFYTLSTGVADNRASNLIGAYRSDINDPFLMIAEDLYELATSNVDDERAEWFEERVLEDGSSIYVSTKFNSDYQNVALIHLVDLLLMRAECHAINDDVDDALEDLNAVRNRAGLASLSPVSIKEQILEDIQDQRRIEMSLEGDRILQQKRRGAAGEDIIIRGADWDCSGIILQFPAAEGFPGFEFNEQGGC